MTAINKAPASSDTSPTTAPLEPALLGRQTSSLGQGPSQRASLGFKDLVYGVTLKNGTRKQILRSCTGAIMPGEVLAIMGPSGSGKTSLLDLLANRLRGGKGSTFEGEVLLNGKRASPRQRRMLMSYVAQEDSLMGVFTVRETLWFAARLYYGYTAKTKNQIEIQIETLIDSMGLRASADTVVGNIFKKGLSGGQQKRLSVAIELISSPPIILLDEPTSGLDSASAYAIMKELRRLASLGHTIVATIHQPSSEIWNLFDLFMLLGAGRCCYFGEAKSCIAYFAGMGYPCPVNFNPADYVINLVTTDFDLELFRRPASIDELATGYDASTLKAAVERRLTTGTGASLSLVSTDPAITTALTLEGSSSLSNSDNNTPSVGMTMDPESQHFQGEEGNPSWYRRSCIAGGGYAGLGSNFVTLTHRNALNVLRNPGIIVIREVMYLMLALLLGLTFLYQGRSYDGASVLARNSLLFFVAAFFVFMSVAVLPFIIDERAVFLREKRNGWYKPLPYVLSQFVTLLPGTFMIALSTSILIVFMVSLNGFGYYVLCLWLSLIAAETFQLLVASVSPHYIIGIAVAAGFFGLSMIVEGFFIVFTTIGWYIRWIGYITFHRYAFRAFMRNEYATIQNLTAPGFSTGQDVLDFYFPPNSIYIHTIGGDLGVLVLFAVSYLFLFWMVLEFYW